MKPIILRDDTKHLGEIRDHEFLFYDLDFGDFEAEKIIIAQLSQSTGVPESYLVQNQKNRPWWLQ